MSFPPSITRRRRREAVVHSTILEITFGTALACAIALTSHHLGLFERFIAFSRRYESYDLDEVLIFLAISAVMLAVFSVRRYYDARREADAAAASEARLEALFSASPFPIGLFSLDDGTLLHANVKAERAAGAPLSDLIGRRVQDLPYWDADTATELPERVRREGAVREFEVNTSNGIEVRPVLVSAQSVILDGARCFIASMSDISRLRAAERAREASLAELRSVFEAMREVVLVLGADGEYLEIPATNSDLLYRPPAELVGKRVHEVLPADAADAVCAVIRRSLDERAPVATEYSLPFAGQEIWFSAIVTPMSESSVLWVARDISKERRARQALRESEAHYRLLFQSNPMPMWVVDAEHRFVDVNDSAVRHYGYSRDEFLKMNAADIRPAEDVARFRQARAEQWPVTERRLFRHLKRDGSIIDVEVSRDEIQFNGQSARLVLAIDVTERERALAEQRVISARFASAFGDAPIGMTIMGLDGRWFSVNGAMCDMLGRTPDELVGRTSVLITHPDDVAGASADLDKLRSGQRSTRMETRYIHSSGREVTVLVHSTRLTGEGNTGLIISHVLDVTDVRAAEAVMRRQAMVFETISEAVVITTPYGTIMDANAATTAIFGYAREELVGQTPKVWQQADADPPIYDSIGRALRSTGRWSGEYGFVSKDGRTGIVESTVIVLRDQDGSARNCVGVMRDLTESREMQRQLLQAQKLEAIGSLASGIAHEINTPTQYVGDNVRFLSNGIGALADVVEAARDLAGEAKRHAALSAAVVEFDRRALDADVEFLLGELPSAAQHAKDGCERIAHIVAAMRSFAHPGATQRAPADLNVLVANTIAVSRNEWKYVASLSTEFADDLPLVPCVAGDVQQVVLNLIVNAAYAIAEAHAGTVDTGHITVSTCRDGDWVELRVADDGCGIPDAIQGKIFDPFFTTKGVGAGTGQGLAICHAMIVNKHKGSITFNSEPGRGTTFHVRLPLGSGIERAAAA